MSAAKPGDTSGLVGGLAFSQPIKRPVSKRVMAVRNSTRHYRRGPGLVQVCTVLQTCPEALGGLSVGMRFALLFLGLLLAAEAAPQVGPPPAKVRKALKLDAFYTKHVDVEGFAVVGSKRVADAAMLEAADIVLTMTRTHLRDAALKSPAFYIGALGSRKTHASRVDRLRESGWTDDDLARIHAPVGMNIRARTPAEIAVSIVAQIIE